MTRAAGAASRLALSLLVAAGPIGCESTTAESSTEREMRVEVAMRSTGVGYFPGRAKPVAIDTRELPPEQAQRLRSLVDAADLYALPNEVPPRPGAADYRTYVVTVEEEGRRHSATVSDPDASPALLELIRFVRDEKRRADGP